MSGDVPPADVHTGGPSKVDLTEADIEDAKRSREEKILHRLDALLDVRQRAA